MDIILDEIEARVLGALVEKEITTPEYYPLSLNALVNACNQKSNRDPVMNLDEDAVRQALRSLNDKNLAGPADTFDSRVTKYEHRLQEAFNFTRPETALLCVLLLRGPQTLGELRGRTERMHRFDDLPQVLSGLERLISRQPPLVKVLPRLPGTKESRYAHLLCGDAAAAESTAPVPGSVTRGVSMDSESVDAKSADETRIARLEDDVAALHAELADLKQQLAEFRKQFE